MSQIHQEVMFDAAPARVYRALTDSGEFAKVTGAAADICPDEGGSFSCFDTLILGRNVQLIEGTRIVALCGTEFIPTRDPSRYPVCPACREVLSRLRAGGSN